MLAEKTKYTPKPHEAVDAILAKYGVDFYYGLRKGKTYGDVVIMVASPIPREHRPAIYQIWQEICAGLHGESETVIRRGVALCKALMRDPDDKPRFYAGVETDDKLFGRTTA